MKTDIEIEIEELEESLAAHGDDADRWYRLGNLYRMMSLQGKALTAYMHAAKLDPASPATQAAEMMQEILDYRNTDLLNP